MDDKIKIFPALMVNPLNPYPPLDKEWIKHVGKPHKCEGCRYVEYEHDMGATIPYCSRGGGYNFEDAIKRYESYEPCAYKSYKD